MSSVLRACVCARAEPARACFKFSGACSWGLLVLVLASSSVASHLSAQSSASMPAVNDLPNPYRTVAGWAKLPEGRTWGSTSAVAIDKDGKSIWVAERCGVNNCPLYAGPPT